MGNAGSRDRDIMGQVIGLIKVMPADGADYAKMKEKVMAAVKVEKADDQPIAFGLVALKITVVVEDGAGGFEPIEKKLNEIEEVGDVIVEDVGRL